MTQQLSPHDYEQLSAYLDGQLQGRERDKVEYRVRTYPEWRAGLEELQFTRRMLRSLPRRRAPRNFTLKPDMVRKTPAVRFFPVFRLVSAIASILLVITFASDLALNLTAQRLPMMSAPAASTGSTAATELTLPAQPNQAMSDSAATQAAETEATNAPFAAAPMAPDASTPESATDAAGFAMNSAPVTDETATAIAAQTTAPQGKGGSEPLATNSPESTIGVQVAPVNTPTPEPGIGSLSTGPNATPTLPPYGLGGGPAAETPSAEPAQSTLALATTATATAEVQQSEPPRASVTLNPQAAPQFTSTAGPQAALATPTPAEPAPGERVGNPNEQPATPPSTGDYEPVLRKLEVIFAVIAVLTGIAALIFRSRFNG